MAHPALLTLILSGFVTWLLNSWGPLYKLNLLLHPLLGVGFTVVMFYFAWRRFSRLGPNFSAARWVGVPIALSILFAVPGIATADPSRFYWLMTALVAILTVGLWRLSRALELGEWFVAACNYVGFGLWAMSVLSGLSVLTLSRGGGITHIVLLHRNINIAFTAVFVLMILLSLAGVFAKSRAFADEQPRIWASVVSLFSRGMEVRDEQPRAWTALTWTTVAALVLAALAGIERISDATAPTFTIPLSTIPIEKRIESERVIAFADPRVEPVALDLTASCATGAGCHESIVKSFRHSNHAFSAETPHLQKSLALLRSEIGEPNTKICAGCHTPGVLFERTADSPPTFEKVTNDTRPHSERPNMSCSFCHMVRDVWIGPEHSLRSSYTLQPPVAHLNLFLRDGKEITPTFLDSILIRLNPIGHAREFSAPVLATDRFCDSCHHQQIPVEQQTGLVKPRCIDCHMRSLDEFGASGSVRSHLLPGANVTVPIFAGRQEAAALVNRWMDGKFPFSIAGWENRGWERLGGRALATWLWMLYETKDDARPGHDYTIEILTADVGVGHRFPAAPLDLVEAWLEVRVRDADDRVIFEQGFADSKGNIPGDAHRLGGSVVGEDGKRIEHYRVWQTQHDVVDRVMEPGVPIRDRYTFPIPEEVKGPLTVAAEWKYRKLNREILDWAYGPSTTVPAVVVGSFSAKIPLAGRDGLELSSGRRPEARQVDAKDAAAAS
ncbi:MAG: hypothetical protein HY270_15340 [Deltaproteobacteria bacterium]|nr:hypothetical protein [Deltaproteobacteria bacterium]